MAIDIEFDQKHIWHPYTSMTHPLPGYPVAAAEGCELILDNGQKLVDGMASWWCAIHGYNVPELNEAVNTQLTQMSHVMFGGITHAPAIELCKTLVGITPEALDRVFLADSGSVAVEVALKMALQYWRGKGVTGKTRFAALTHAYHGDTFGAMSVCDPLNGMHSLFSGFMAENLFLETPPIGFDTPIDDQLLSQWRDTLSQHKDSLAALIVEPVVQGAGGMRIYNPQWLTAMRQLCDELGILLIFDEIATGFGRTGRLFALEHAGVVPDILCLGKAITGGYMTLSATLTSEQVANAVCESEAGVFMHGPTFMGNPLACAVAKRSLDLLMCSDWQMRVAAIDCQISRELLPLRGCPGVTDVRVLGAIGVVEMDEPVDVATVQKIWVEEGVWIRPFGRLVYIMPSYTISASQLTRLTNAICGFVDRLGSDVD